MNMRPLKLAALAATCALCGCVTQTTDIDKRIAQRAEAFDALDAEQQDRVRLGHIQIGDTTNMLWMVFGEPAEVSTNSLSAAGDDGAFSLGMKTEAWAYVREPLQAPPPLPRSNLDGYQPGAMFVHNPPQTQGRVKKIYILRNGVITGMDTQTK